MSIQSFAQNSEVEILEKKIANGIGDTIEVNERNHLFKLLFRIDPDRGKIHLDKALKLAKKLNYLHGEATCYRRYAIYYTSHGDYEQAQQMLNKAKPIFKKMDDMIGVNSCINGEANIRISQGSYDQALDLYMRSDQLCDKANLQNEMASAKHNISLVYYTLKEFNKALDYLSQSLEIKKSLSDSTGMLFSYNGIGAILSAQNKHFEALTVLRDALVLGQQLENPKECASILNNIGAQFYYLDEPDSTRHYYLESLAIYQKFGMKKNIAEIYSNLGNLEVHLKNGMLASNYYDSCLVIAQEINALATVSIAYEGLSKANELRGNFKGALNWYTKFHHLNDSLVGERVKLNINELQEKYESGKKDLQIAKLEKGEAEAMAVADKRKYLLMIVGLLTSVLVILLILYIGRKRAKVKLRITELEQKALRSQMNPHFIFNSLNSIQRLYIEGKEDEANDYMADFSSLLRQILENSSMDKVSLTEEIRSTTLYLDLEKMRTDNLFDYEFDVDPNIDQLNTFVPPLILQPFVENAIWHGIVPRNEHGNIIIRIIKVGVNDLECIIIDDGIGIKESMNQKISTTRESKGMSITADRLGGENYIVVSELETGGTEIKLRIRKVV